MPDLHSQIRSPYFFLILGIILFSAAAAWTYTGKVRTRFQGWVCRTEEPNEFWWLVAMYYLGGILFIGIFLYLVT